MKNKLLSIILSLLFCVAAFAVDYDVHTDSTTGDTLYFCTFDESGQVFLSNGESQEDWGTGGRDADDYDMGLAEVGTSGHFVGTFDNSISAGRYTIKIYKQAGANPVDGEEIGTGLIHWSGAAEVFGFDTSGRADVGKWLGTAVNEDTAGYPKVTVKDGTGIGEINTDAGKIVEVSTLTGHTAQTGNSYPKVDTEVAMILADTGNTLETHLTDIKGAGFVKDTHSLPQCLTATSTTVSDKTGFKLASDGLDDISITSPTNVATNFREMMVQLWRRFFKKASASSSEIKTYDGATVMTTQTISVDGSDTVVGDAAAP